ncbi:MAG: pilus assembly protein PilP [Myxococcales bacterium]|nr:pilus assembly protein PilP [Myxococcales bacterium]MCB9643426.1 pilus assembly protein PilP [Myxococcales bacterium]
MKTFLHWTCLFALSWALLGCDDDLRAQFDEEYRPPPMKPIKRSITLAQPNVVKFVYSPVKKRDPFRSHFISNRGDAPPSTSQTPTAPPAPIIPKRILTPLERYELDSLRVVATITGVANPMAMIEIPEGNRGFIARRGTLIGKNSGRITRIYPDGIVVSEVYRNVIGQRIVNRVTLRIKRKNNNIEGSLEVGGRKITLGPDGQTDTNTGTSNEARRRTRRLFRQSGAGAGP